MKTFLEIGTADFDTLLPMAQKGGWGGWCVEPIPKHAATMREKVKGLPVGIVEAAISDFDGHLEMAVGGGEDWAEGISHVISPNHTGVRLLDMVENAHLFQGQIRVPCMKLDTLLDECGINEIDFCKIDVEGHELQVLTNYSWRVKPKILKVEHKHIPSGSLEHLLLPQGYTIFTERDDIYCIL